MTSDFALIVPIADVKPNAKEFLTNLTESFKDYPCPKVACWDVCNYHIIDEFRDLFDYNLINDGNRFWFAKNCNVGLHFAHTDLELSSVLVNMDTILPKWDKFKLLANAGVGLATPKTTESLEDLDKGTGEHQAANNKFAFYCPFIHKDVIDTIGYLDERFPKVFNDDDYIARALLAGLPVSIVDLYVNHKGSHIDQAVNGGSLCGTYNGDDLMVGLQKFIWKWSIDLSQPGMLDSNGNPDTLKFIPYILDKFQWDKNLPGMFCK